MKKYILGLLTGLVISITIAVSATILYQANEIGFTPADNNWNVNNLESALNDLYNGKSQCNSNDSWSFSYKNAEDEFSAPKAGKYKLEVWGAQGGNATDAYVGGFGGYSVGEVTLVKNEKLYINVGGQGSSGSVVNDSAGGYNGGGTGKIYASDDKNYVTGGGGATHIAKEQGLLSELSQYLGEYDSARKTYNSNKILIVAGGGGGSYYHSNGAGYSANGGSGGGNVGHNGNTCTYTQSSGGGGTQTAGGGGGTNGSAGSYGQGSIGGQGTSGGGGGLYGGGSARHAGSGGGSGYIGSSLLTNKHMTCYDCTTSNDEHVKTETTLCASEDPIKNCAKINAGFAKITYLGNSN